MVKRRLTADHRRKIGLALKGKPHPISAKGRRAMQRAQKKWRGRMKWHKDGWCRNKRHRLKEVGVRVRRGVRYCQGCQQEAVLRRFGLSAEEIAKVILIKTCEICGKPLETRLKRQKWLLPALRERNVDHDHETGKFRGIVCLSCNVLLGHAHDDPGLLRKAAAYLKRKRR
jgi:hypothetical protein